MEDQEISESGVKEILEKEEWSYLEGIYIVIIIVVWLNAIVVYLSTGQGGSGLGLLIVTPISLWVLKDAKRRGLTSRKASAWAIGSFLLIFLPLYLRLRPAKQTLKRASNPSKRSNNITIVKQGIKAYTKLGYLFASFTCLIFLFSLFWFLMWVNLVYYSDKYELAYKSTLELMFINNIRYAEALEVITTLSVLFSLGLLLWIILSGISNPKQVLYFNSKKLALVRLLIIGGFLLSFVGYAQAQTKYFDYQGSPKYEYNDFRASQANDYSEMVSYRTLGQLGLICFSSGIIVAGISKTSLKEETQT